MNFSRYITLLLLLFYTTPLFSENLNETKNFLREINWLWAQSANRYILSKWDYDTNITDATYKAFVTVDRDVAKYQKLLWTKVNQFSWKNITDLHVRRQFELFSKNIAVQILPEEKYMEFENIQRTLESIPDNTRIPRRRNQPPCLSQFDVEEILRTSRNVKELIFVWSQWNNAVGGKALKLYPKYVELLNEAAKLQNLPNAEALWLSHYSDFVNIKPLAQTWWKQLEPFYKELHAYVRYKLRLKYGDYVPEDGGIPAYLCGNLFGQDWRGISDIVLPFPISKELKIEESLKNQNYTPLGIMKNGNDFFVSLHLPNLPKIFWEKSIFHLPTDSKNTLTHGLTYKLYQSDDVFCLVNLTLSVDSYLNSHWFAGECRFERTARQPYIFEDMPKGVDLAICEAIGLSAKTSRHMRKMALLPGKKESFEEQINNLLHSALVHVPFLPYAYIIDLWRWNVFAGKIIPENYNTDWWSLRFNYQGVDTRCFNDEKNHFDIWAKHSILFGKECFGYYVGSILSFQIHKALCAEARLYFGRHSGKALCECDIYGSFEAGNLLKIALVLGRSKPFPDFLEALTGERSVNTSTLLEYYEPLINWLKEENVKNGVTPGWNAESLGISKNLRFDLL